MVWFTEQPQQSPSFASVARDRPAKPRRLLPHPTMPGVYVKATRDGDDFIRVCERHRWASPALPMVTSCPVCLSEADAASGRERFEQMQTALALGL